MGSILGMQEWFNVRESVIGHIDKMRGEKKILSIGAKKAFDRIQHPIIIKALKGRLDGSVS